MDRPLHLVYGLLLLVALIALPQQGFAQPSPIPPGYNNWFICNNVAVTNCNPQVPSLLVDLRGDPDMRWYSCAISRGTMSDQCCGYPQVESNERCIEFKVLLNPLARAVIIEIPSAADPMWQTDRTSHPNGAPGSP